MNCKGCDQDRYYNSPDRTAEEMEAAQPPVINHTCREEGPRTKKKKKKKKKMLAAIHEAAVRLHYSFSSQMPGGNYHAKQEIDDLLLRLAEFKVPGRVFGSSKDRMLRYWENK